MLCGVYGVPGRFLDLVALALPVRDAGSPRGCL
jgi:hypothetical protein